MSEAPSAFIRAALELEKTFASLEQLSQSLERLELNGEANLQQAKKLLVRFSQQSGELPGALLSFTESLQARRQSVERAVALVDTKAPQVAAVFGEMQEKVNRFQDLADRVASLSNQALRLGPVELRRQFESLLEELVAIQEEAKQSKLRTLENNARNLRATLKGLSRELD